VNPFDPTALALFGAFVVVVTWGLYWPLIRQHRVPRRPRSYQAAAALGAVAALVALASGPAPGGVAAALVALIGAGFFLFTTLTSALPAGGPAVRTGDRYLDFEARDWQGREFRLAALDGRRFILKFYRGHW
jgi:hypothetical protein